VLAPGAEPAELHARLSKTHHLQCRHFPGVLILHGQHLAEIGGPHLVRVVDDDVLTGNPIDHVFSELRTHCVVVSRESDADQIVIIVGLARVIQMVDIQHLLPRPKSGLDPSRGDFQAIHLNPTASVVEVSRRRLGGFDDQTAGLQLDQTHNSQRAGSFVTHIKTFTGENLYYAVRAYGVDRRLAIAHLKNPSGLAEDWLDADWVVLPKSEETKEGLMGNADYFDRLAEAIVVGEPEEAEELAKAAMSQGLDALECINQGLTVGMKKVGELFATGEYYLPELIIGADAMKAALAILEPALLGHQQRDVLGRVVLGTVEGDVHDIGKTLVGTLLTANGFEVKDIGFDQPPGEFVAAVEETNATLVGASALLTTTMLKQKAIIEELASAGLRDQVKVMVGGAPVAQAWAEKIGADGYAVDAIGAVALARQLVGAEPNRQSDI